MKKRSHFIVSIFVTCVFLFSVSGCALFNKGHNKMEKTAQQLAEEGVDAFRNGNFKESIKSFETLKDWYPFSKYAILAELKIADAHYEIADAHYEGEGYDVALSAYHEFEKMHPLNDAVPYVIYREGMCWYKRISTVDRDQSFAKKGLAQFKRLVARFPNSKYADNAAKKIKKCIDNLAGHEFYVANFYLKAKHYKAALKRFEYIFAHYPDTKEAEEAISIIPEYQKLADAHKKNNG